MTPSRKARASRDPLRAIPGVGPRMAEDLRRLGYRTVADLRNADPEAMYAEICRLTKSRQDPCVLYVFRAAVYFASRRRHDPKLLQWWNWKSRRLV